MREFIATFGIGVDNQFRGGFVRVRANSFSMAQEKMEDQFGAAWSFLYDSEEAAGVARFGLLEVDFDRKRFKHDRRG